jgi:hypothetical protein
VVAGERRGGVNREGIQMDVEDEKDSLVCCGESRYGGCDNGESDKTAKCGEEEGCVEFDMRRREMSICEITDKGQEGISSRIAHGNLRTRD